MSTIADNTKVFSQRESSSLLSTFVDAGVLTGDAVERAERGCARTGCGAVDVVIRLGLCDEGALASTLARLCDLPLMDIHDVPNDPIRLTSISIPFLREAKVLPIAEDETTIIVAVADPTNSYLRKSLELAFGKTVQFRVGTASQIEDAVLRLYADGLGKSASELLNFVSGNEFESDYERLRESADEAPIVRFVDRLIAKAIDAGASDIHLEPFERQMRVRLRVDGVLVEDDPAPLESSAAVVSRIKIMARLDIAERRLPQDGAMKISVRGRDVDFRVATTPVIHGEEVVIRILDQSTVRLSLSDLGFSQHVLKQLMEILARPNGIILVTGPTGSGKSTTLYAALEYLNRSDRKIITVEDPVEYKIHGLNQIQVKPDIGLDFAKSLRSILRHDPDIIMVGEIRDPETASIAVQAALTGHLVLSTLHTNDAASAVTRLLDMGVEEYLITSTLSGVLAQRLIRTLCPKCRIIAEYPSELKIGASRSGRTFRHGGCTACRGTGFRGRTIIAEFMGISPDVRQKIQTCMDAGQLRKMAIASGMQTLFESGMEAVLNGSTSYDEVVRVAHDLEARE